MYLSFVRTNAYRGKRKIMDISTTTLEDGPIWTSLNSCEEIRDNWAACPFCGAMQIMKFDNIHWPEEEKDPERIKNHQLAWYECADCGEHWDDYRRDQAVRAGCWVPRVRRDKPGSVGFWLPGAWYSPFVSISECAAAYVKAKPVRDGKVRDRRAWINFLNQYANLPYKEEEGELPDWEKIRQRAENYGPRVPMRAGVLTAYADVQDDRIEAEVVAWGVEEESWSIERHIIPGVPSTPMVWRELDEFLRRKWRHESGAEMRIAAAGVDTGGHFTKQAYQFVKKKYHRRVYGTKGASQANKPLVSRPTRSNLGKIPLFLIGTDTAKETIYSRLNLDQGEDGYMHLPSKYDEEYFKQLVSEKPKIRYGAGGRPVREWVKIRERNETLDLWVGNMAILAILNPNLRKLVRDLQQQAGDPLQESFDLDGDPPDEETEETESEAAAEDLDQVEDEIETESHSSPESHEVEESPAKPKARGRAKKRKSSWMNGW
jgi:phage terminase large subunit GpA-like protein